MKTSAHQIATRYVKALFDSSDDSLRVKVEKDLKALAAFLSERAVAKSLLSPLLTRAQRAQATEAVLTKMKAQPITQQFAALLAAHRRLVLIPDISKIFSDWAAHSRGEIKAELVSASPLKEKDVAAVSARLSKASGKNVIVETSANPELLGGLVIKVGSQQLDSSLAGKLSRLAVKLKTA